MEQWQRYSDRLSTAYAQQDTPEWPALDEAAARSGLKFAHLRDELAEYCATSAATMTELVVAAVAPGARGGGAK